MEKRFVERYAATGDAAYAATKAGYAHPAVRGAELVQKPAIAAAVRDRVNSLLDDLAPKALTCLGKIVADEAAPARDRIAAAKPILTQWAARDAQSVSDKTVAEMTMAEILARMAELTADRARLIIEHDPTVFDQPDPSDDVLD